MCQEKKFLDVDDMVNLLVNRGVIIENKEKAREIILNNNYYSLINGYRSPFIKKKEKYMQGTRFEEIYELYEVDRKLKILTMEYILEIEKKFKSLVSYCFSKAYGHKNYLNIENFDAVGSKFCKTIKLLSNMYNKICMNYDSELYMKHYVNTKNYVPLWVLVNAISIGDISKFYINMLPKHRSEVAKMFKLGVRENELGNYIYFLSSIRNRCAHDQVLFSYESYLYIKDSTYFDYFGDFNRKKYFSVVFIFKRLLSENKYNYYYEGLTNLINELENNLTTIKIYKIYKIMGMPMNWKDINKLYIT